MSTFESLCFAIVWFLFAIFGIWRIAENYFSKIEKKIDTIIDKIESL